MLHVSCKIGYSVIFHKVHVLHTANYSQSVGYNQRMDYTVNKIMVTQFYNGWLQYHLSQLILGVWLLLIYVWNVHVWYMFNNMKDQIK